MSYIFQPIVNLVAICAQKSVKRVVLSPGSRVAPLTLAFSRHPQIKTYTISDERSAAFVALGMAQQTDLPVAIACTSGTASLNYGPAIAEAFYQQVPLVVITADRPPEWVDQQDGQTIRQERLHLNHTKASYQLPVDYTHSDAQWHVERIVSEAINEAMSFPKGPVHINAPFREPFYPEMGEEFSYHPSKVIEEVNSQLQLSDEQWEELMKAWPESGKVLIVGGQDRRKPRLESALSNLDYPIISDVISNLHEVGGSIKHQDAFLGALAKSKAHDLQPDLLISFGKSVISKNLKLYLRKYKAKEHWHIQESGNVADVFQSLTRIIRTTPQYFIERLEHYVKPTTIEFKERWMGADALVRKFHQQHFSEEDDYSELNIVKTLLEQLPQNANLHLSNSMPVRYANLLNLYNKSEVAVWANRGTSGIDGSNSTVVGHALSNENMHVLLTGDLSFLYDRNAFWHNYPIPNMKIVLLNNQGGIIFRMIDGPRRQTELEEYFVTHQKLGATNLANDFAMNHQSVNDKSGLSKGLHWLFEDADAPKILEIHTDSQKNQERYLAYKAQVRALFAK